jgi:hypothetical protein
MCSRRYPSQTGMNRLLKNPFQKRSKRPDTSNLELFGTIIMGDKKSALIYDNSKQKIDNVQKQVKNKRAGVYYLGDTIGGFASKK